MNPMTKHQQHLMKISSVHQAKKTLESSEEINDSDESKEEDPWGVLIHKAAMELRTKHNEIVQCFQNGGLVKLTQRNKPFQKFYQTFERNWEIFIRIA